MSEFSQIASNQLYIHWYIRSYTNCFWFKLLPTTLVGYINKADSAHAVRLTHMQPCSLGSLCPSLMIDYCLLQIYSNNCKKGLFI